MQEKSSNIWIRWARGLGILLLLFVLAIYGVLHSTRVQTYLVGKITALIGEKSDTEIRIGSVSLTGFKRLGLHDVLILDHHCDTLLFAKRLAVRLSELNLKEKSFTVDEVELTLGELNVVKYKDEETYNIQYFFRSFAKDKRQKDSIPFQLSMEAIALDQFSFSLEDQNREHKPYGVDYFHMRCSDIKADLEHFTLVGDSITSDVKHLSCAEKSGFVLDHLSGKATVCDHMLLVDEMKLTAGQSHLVGKLAFKYKAYTDFKQFVTQVKLDSYFSNSTLSGSDLSYFVPALEGLREIVQIDGAVTGKINRLKLRDFHLQYGVGTSFKGQLNIDGLPDFQNAFMYIDVEEFRSVAQDLSQVPLPPFSTQQKLELPPWFANLGKISFSGSYTGFISDFVAYGRMDSECGKLESDIKFAENAKGRLSIDGSLVTREFDLKKLLGNKELGRLSFKGDVHALVDSTAFKIGMLGDAPLLEFHGYPYTGITVDGTLTPKDFEGDLTVVDTNLLLDFTGGIAFSKRTNRFKFKAKVDRANLTQLKLLDRDSSTSISFEMDIDLTGSKLDDLQGNVKLKDFNWGEKGQTYQFKNTDLKSVKTKQREMISINSDWFVARIEGKYDLQALTPSLVNILSRDLPSLTKLKYSAKLSQGKNDFKLMFKINDYGLIKSLFTPDLDLTGANFSGYFNDEADIFRMNLNADTIKYRTQYVSKLRFYANNHDDQANISLKTKYLSLSDSIGLQGFKLESSSKNNLTSYDFYWENNTQEVNSAHLSGEMGIERIDSIWTHFDRVDLVVEGNSWQMDSLNEVIFTPKEIRFDHFQLASHTEFIKINGVLSYSDVNNLNVSAKSFELGNLQGLIDRYNTNIEGKLSGLFNLSGTLNSPVIKSDFSVEDFKLNGQLFGKILMKSNYINEEGRLALNLIAENRSKNITGNTVELKGNYFPFQEGKIDLVASLTNLKVQFLEQYFAGVFSDFKRGKASGNLYLKGTLKEIQAFGVLRLDQMNLKVDYLNTDYAINAQSVYFGGDNISFRNFKLRHDLYTSSEATVNGIVRHKGFKNFTYRMDSIRLKNMLCLNTTIDDNSTYYGTAFANGLLRMHGDGKNNTIEGTVSTVSYEDKLNKGTTHLNLPLSEVGELEVSDFIHFVNLRENKVKREVEDQLDLSGLSMDLNFLIHNEASAKIIFDPAVGDEIEVNGEGSINMKINSEGKFLMSGNYEIEKGRYYFTLKNFVGKKFLVEKGSSISWDGDPLDATIDLKTHYQARAKLIDLISVNASNYEELSQRYGSRNPVNADMRLTGKLMQPDISMGISLPEGTAEEKEFLTTHVVGEDETNRQIFSLLLQNKFFTVDNENNGAIAQAGAVGIDNGIQFLEGQLNNALGGLMNNVDLGVDYNSSTDSISNAELRLLVGFQYKKFSVKTDFDVSNQVGEIQVEYRITDRFKARAYSKKLDNIVVETGATVTHGAGMVYQKSFNSIRDLFRREEKRKSKNAR